MRADYEKLRLLVCTVLMCCASLSCTFLGSVFLGSAFVNNTSAAWAQSSNTAPTTTSTISPDESLRMTPVVRAVQEAGSAVVNITSTKEVRQRQLHPLHELFFGQLFPGLPNFPQGRQRTRTSLGSGVIVDGEQGLVLTNAHVVAGGDRVQVNLLDGREFEGIVVGAEPDFDVAVLKLQGASHLPSVRIRTKNDLFPGETVIAIGNPFGFAHTVTTGVISATDRTIRGEQGLFTGLIQTDAAINPGNSGGPLLNILGELVGINTAIDARAEGIGFAIPIDKALRVMDDLLGKGQVSPLWLGIAGQDVEPGIAMALNLDESRGLIVSHVYEGTPAAVAGVKSGDVIVHMDSTHIRDRQEYLQFLRNTPSGNAVDVRIIRQREIGGQQIQLSVTPVVFDDVAARAICETRWGFRVQEQNKRLVVISVDEKGPAAMLRKGDVIGGVSNVRMHSMKDFLDVFRQLRMAGQVQFYVIRGGRGYSARLRFS